jgi:rod shape-determining protein MreD
MVVVAVVAVLLQAAVAPSMAVMSVVPNFMLIILAILALHNDLLRSTICGFALGLVFDLLSSGPLGAMTLVLTLLGYIISSLNKYIARGGLLVEAFILFLAMLSGEFLNSVLYAITGSDTEFLLSLAVKVLPATLYDTVMGLLLLWVYLRLFTDSGRPNRPGPGRPLQRKLN